MAEIRLDNIHKTFGKVIAVQDISLTVPDQEFIVLLGPSGCGKTTLLRCVAGLEQVDRGRVFIGGRDVTDLPPRSRDIAMVFQSYAVFPHMTVFDNIAFGLQMQKHPSAEIKRRVHAAAGLLQIETLLDRYPAQLSGGQRQRVAVARALVMEPAVLLLDEPLSNLDAKLRLRMRTELKRLHKTVEFTIVYVTHDQVEAMSLADRMAVINQGVLIQEGPPLEVYNRPQNMFVAGFIGSPPINFLKARLTEKDGDLCVTTPDFTLRLPPDKAARARESAKSNDVVLGIRPQDVHERARVGSADGGNTVHATVDVMEPLGDAVVVTVMTGEESLQVTLPADTRAQVDQPVELAIDVNRVHLFDPETEEAIF
jgi:multiple sugar transport system ATP-binding protein